jgi:hypothetical protein
LHHCWTVVDEVLEGGGLRWGRNSLLQIPQRSCFCWVSYLTSLHL